MFELPPLPYAANALEPVTSEETLRTHHDKHHAKYVETTNQLLAAAGSHPASLEDVIADSRGRAAAAKLFNNAAQAWNHTYFWAAMSPRRTSPGAVLALAIDQNAGGLAGLKQTFVAEGAAHFGSGWVWVFAEGDIVKVRTTHDAETMADSASTTPLLVCDLWEHAYYLDHKQDREGFLTAWFDALPNWDLATAQFEAAGGRGGAWRHPVPTQVGT